MVDDVDAITFYTKMLGFDLTFNAGPPFKEVRRLRLPSRDRRLAGRPMPTAKPDRAAAASTSSSTTSTLHAARGAHSATTSSRDRAASDMLLDPSATSSSSSNPPADRAATTRGLGYRAVAAYCCWIVADRRGATGSGVGSTFSQGFSISGPNRSGQEICWIAFPSRAGDEGQIVFKGGR
jgi:hypothetical protein